MKKSLTMSALAVIAAVGLAACVKQVWQTRYSIAGNAYTDSETVVTAPDGN